MTKFYIEKILLNINDSINPQRSGSMKLKIKDKLFNKKPLIAHSIISAKSDI